MRRMMIIGGLFLGLGLLLGGALFAGTRGRPLWIDENGLVTYQSGAAATAFKICGADGTNCPINAYEHGTKGPVNEPICSGGPCDPVLEIFPGKTLEIKQSDGDAGLKVFYSEIGVLDMLERSTDPIDPTAASGRWKLYFKGDGLWIVGDDGTPVGPLGTGGGGSTSKYFDAVAMVPDGTNCVAWVMTLNTGPLTDVITCADSNSSIIYGKTSITDVGGCPASTLNMSVHVYHSTTESTTTFAGDFSAMYRRWGGSDVVNATWSSPGVASNAATIVTAHEIETTAAASVTPNGTCDATTMLFWRYVINATNFTAAPTTNHILGVTIAHP